MNETDIERRKEIISELYKEILQREPDEPGLKSYVFSDLSVEAIAEGMKNSLEFQELLRRRNFGKQLEKLGSEELLLMGSSPRNEDHVESIKKSEVKAILSLDQKFERPYDHDWCGHFCNVSLTPTTPITKEQASEILDFIYTSVVINGLKTFIHSDMGMSRAPMAVCLFLVAEKKMPFAAAMNVVTSKQQGVNPHRSLLTGELLNFVKEYKFKDAGKAKATRVQTQQFVGASGSVEYVGLNNNLFVGSKLTTKLIAEFRKAAIDVVVDINESRTKLPPEAQWFSHIHLPLTDDNMKEMMPVIIRNVRRYIKRGRVYVMCSEVPKVLVFAENFVANFDDVAMKERLTSIRGKILSL